MDKDKIVNISSSPDFISEETKQKFLMGQLEIWNKIRDGEKTWDDLSAYRQEYGYPEVNIDSLRRSFQSLGNYYDAGWIKPTAEGSLSSTPDTSTVKIVYDKDETTSEKVIEVTEEELRDPKAVMRAHGFNPDEWRIVSASHTKTRRTSAVNGDSNYYSSRITVKPIINHISDIKEIAKIFEGYKSPGFTRPNIIAKTNEYFVLPIYDLHWGRLEAKEEYTGFDVEEEKEKILEHFRRYADKLSGRKFKKVFLIIGQDFLNSSYTGFTSSQKHLQSNNMDFFNMFKSGAELLVDLIEMFRGFTNEVCVIGSLGNHDIGEEYALFCLLEHHFRNDTGVHIDSSNYPRKYLDLGSSCVGVGHLDKEGDRAFGLMQTEAKDIWARTRTHIFFAGHLHHFEVNNQHGVELYRIPTICPLDRWTVEKGFTQSERKSMGFVFDENEGLIETYTVILE